MYCDTIPVDLAKRLKEKGMHQLRDSRMEGWLNSGDNITYAEVIDWLMSEKDISICIYHEVDWLIGWSITQYYKTIHRGEYYKQWHEAATAAIEKALTLI